MSGFNPFERTIARVLSKFPFLKGQAKTLYVKLVFLKFKKKYRSKTTFPVVAYDNGNENFFGYYDKSPCNNSGLVLMHETAGLTSKIPSLSQDVRVVLYDAEQKRTLWSKEVSSFNWQQGARLHWVSGDHFIYNDFDLENRKYVAKTYSSSSLELVKQYGYPVQDSYKEDFFLSLNYIRLMALRPDYGYRNLPPLNKRELAKLEDDGIWRVDFKTGRARLVISIADACKLEPITEFEQATHKFNHVMISPNGKSFIFMHRYLIGKRRFDRLILADSSTGEMILINDHGMVSHCYWADERTVIGYMRGPELIDGYWLIDVVSGTIKPFEHDKLAKYGDGHPHVYGDWFITDSYPDKARMQHLILCNWKTGEVNELGEFFHGFDYVGESRCDLHPRFSADGKSVFFDSVFSGKRLLYKMDITQ